MAQVCESKKIDSNISGTSYAEERCLGELPVQASAVAATGIITLNGIPQQNNTVTVNGDTYTFVNTPAASGDVKIGLSAAATATSLATAIDADADLSAAAVGSVVTVTASTAGEAGNLIAMAKSGAIIALSGSTLSGGSDDVGGPVWYGVEPNSYGEFGGTNTMTQRTPINPSRQNKKGKITDKSAAAGWNEDFTQNNMTRPLQGFFFADAREAASTKPLNGEQIVLTAVTANQIQAASGMNQFVAGDLVLPEGLGILSNNSLNRVTASASGSITLSGALSAEAAPPADAFVRRVGFQFASGDLNFAIVGGQVVLQSTAYDFGDLPNVFPGTWIFVGGDDITTRFAQSVGMARISKIEEHALTLDNVDWLPIAELGTGKTIQIFTALAIRNEYDPSLIVRRSFQFERTLGEGEFGTQAEYVEGAVANELTFNIPEAEKVNIDLSFVACKNSFRTGDPGDELKAGTRVPALGEEAYSTATDMLHFRIFVHDDTTSSPEPLFGYASTGTLTIGNGVTGLKALGILGNFEMSTGNFVGGGTAEVYFANVKACRAIERNADVGMSMAFASANKGFLWDIPLLGLGGGQITLEPDNPIKLPLEINGAENRFGYTMAYFNFSYLPDIAMPQ